MGSNPAATRNEKNAHWVDPCTEGAPIVRQDLSGLSRTRPVEKTKKKKKKKKKISGSIWYTVFNTKWLRRCLSSRYNKSYHYCNQTLKGK